MNIVYCFKNYILKHEYFLKQPAELMKINKLLLNISLFLVCFITIFH